MKTGILTQASKAKTETEKAEAKERVQLEVLGSYGTDGKIDVATLKSNLATNVPEATIGEETELPLTVTLNGYTFTVDANGKVELSGPQAEVTDAKIVVNSDGTGETDSVLDNSQTEGRKLYISFKASIEGGTIKSVTSSIGTPTLTNGIYVTEITKNGTYTFTIIGTVDGEDYETTYTMEVKKYALRAGLNVGDYINYEPDTVTTAYTKLGAEYTGYDGTSQPASLTQDKLNWQILKKYEDGSMDVIGSPTSADIWLKGARGYNNGVYVLNDICEELYSKKSKGITARSVNEEDFYNNMTDAGKAAKATYISDQVKALTTGDYITNVDTENNTVTYVKARAYYPLLYKQEQLNGLGQSEEYYTESTLIKTEGKGISYDQEAETLTVPYTSYTITTNATNYGDASKALSNSNTFWIASRYVYCGSSYAHFGLCYAFTSIGGISMFKASGFTNAINHRLRPVVHLGAEVQIEACTGTNGTDNMHKITQY